MQFLGLCLRLSQQSEAQLFVQKNGNIDAYDQKTGVYTIKQKPAQEIERKLNDSAYMLECDGVISAEVLGRHFGVIVVVRDERVQRQKDCMVSVGPNPLLMHIQDSVREFKLHKGISASESRYSWVKIMTVSQFTEVYLPFLEDARKSVN